MMTVLFIVSYTVEYYELLEQMESTYVFVTNCT